ncbi:TNF receptor-associated factor 5-like [Corticium candelabrum]|uniref:TNF receptor-associated factor 5-like n=1 Tax=Corticium candelabrum TaxID=121492 RepID=UPI002E2577BC|nr:TNF receptor-associated factor 5-like [Corticium candelabrum]
MLLKEVSDHEDKCSKNHMRLPLENVHEPKAHAAPTSTFQILQVHVENIKLEQNTSKCQNKKPTSLHSSAFYTSYLGYQLCMRVDPNGYNSDNDSFVGVYLVIMKSDFDHQLHWPFSYAYILTVIDQQPHGKEVRQLVEPKKVEPNVWKHYERKTDKSLLAHWFPYFISHSDLTKRAYIKDNSLLLSAEILICK